MPNNKSGMLYSIRTKFLVIILVFTTALMLTVSGLINKTVGEVVLNQGLDKGLAVAKGVAAASNDPLLTDDDLTLFILVDGVTEDKGILYSVIVDSGNIVRAANNKNLVDKHYNAQPDSNIFREGKEHRIWFYNDPEAGYVYDISVPIASLHTTESFGSVHVGISQHVIDETVDSVNRYIRYLTIAGLIIGGLGAFLITGVIVGPVQLLVKSARELGQGNLDHRITVNRRDELGTLMTAFNDMAEGIKQKEVIRESFGAYVAHEVLDMILTNKETWFKGKKVEVTVLFADIRGFTSYSERKDPEALISYLNEYFTLMTEIIQKHNGYIDKFIGDAIMVVFGSPVPYQDHALKAMGAACEMQEKLIKFNLARPEADHIHIGIGINSGEVVAGNLGSSQKMEYAVIGDNVNTASRLCSEAKKDEVIISKSVYDHIKESQFECRPLPPVTVKGKIKPIEIFSLIPRRGPDRDDRDSGLAKRGTA